MSSNSWTPERREKQREVAKDLVAQGVFGGKGRGQGRPRKKRASEIVAEKVADEGQDIFDRLMEITRHGKDSNSIAAASKLLEVEERERKAQLEEEQQIEDMRMNDLKELVWSQLLELNESGIIEQDYDFEGELVSIEERGSSGISEKPEDASG